MIRRKTARHNYKGLERSKLTKFYKNEPLARDVREREKFENDLGEENAKQ